MICNLRRHVKVRYAVFAVYALGLILAIWAFWLEPANPIKQAHHLVLPQWPKSCDGMRIAVLADLHMGSPFNGVDKLEHIIELTRTARPDLILLAGDYVIHGVLGGQFMPPESMVNPLRQLSAPLGIFAVLGNHDWWYDAPRVQRALESANISVVEDTAVLLESGGCAFWLVGISDFWEGPHHVKAALSAVPSGAAILALTHNPDIFPELPPRIALTIAGHTHGGQVYIPFLGRLIVPSRYGERYAIDHIIEQGRHLFVSAGLGTSILPVRFLVPPEVSVLTLQSGLN